MIENMPLEQAPTTNVLRSSEQLVLLPRPDRTRTSAPLQQMRSRAQMIDFTWVVSSLDDPSVVTTGQWLESVVRQHRTDLGCPDAVLTVEYAPLSRQLQHRLSRLRRHDTEIRRMRLALSQRERRRQSERTELIAELSELELLPSEIAEMMGVPLATVATRTGSEQESRVARSLFKRARTARA